MEILNKLKDDQISSLKTFVKNESPFGPANAGKISNLDTNWVLFNKENALCAQYKNDPNIIVGRRGSGKTSIIQNTNYIDEHEFILNIKTNELVKAIYDSINNTSDDEINLVESTCDYITNLIDMHLMHFVYETLNRKGVRGIEKALPKITQYLSSTNIIGINSNSNFLRSLQEVIKLKSDGGLIHSVFSAMCNFIQNENSFNDALDELDNYLKSNKIKSLVVIDSIEDYHLKNEKMQFVIAGLLKATAEYGHNIRRIRLCLPAESYFGIKDVSSNPMKDFENTLLLQWLPKELYSIIAWKYMIYCRIYDESIYKDIKDKSIKDRRQVIDIISRFLPEKITNGLGKEEVTLQYIVRHTQLLPRQIVTIFNKIFGSPDVAFGDDKDTINAKIVDAIKHCEITICDEIFSAYKVNYPKAVAFCERIVPELPRVFPDGELKRVFNFRGRKTKSEDVLDMEYDHFKRMLIEIGCIGRVVSRGDGIIKGEFEYGCPGKLHLSVDDQICLHPLFTGYFASTINARDGEIVYPQFSWFESEKYRQTKVI